MAKLFSFFIMKKMFVFSVILISLSGNLVSADSISKYNKYAEKYSNLEKTCQHILATRTDDAPVRWRNCVWDGDKMLLAEYRFSDDVWALAYDRYAAHFNAAKNAARARINGTEWITPWAEATTNINDSYYRILREEAIR